MRKYKDYYLHELVTNNEYGISFDNVLLVKPLSFYNEVKHRYGDYTFRAYDYSENSSEATNLQNAKTELKSCFIAWLDLVENTYIRGLYNLQKDYNLLLTYEKEIQGEIDLERHKGSKTAHNLNEILQKAKNTKKAFAESKSDTLTLNTTDTLTNGKTTTTTDAPEVKTKNTNYIDSFNSSTAQESGYSEAEVVSGTNTTTTTNSGTDTNAKTGTETRDIFRDSSENYEEYTGTDTDTKTANADTNYTTFTDISSEIFDHDLRKYNNYKESGYNVSPVETLKKEIETRMKNYSAYIISDFVHSYAFYIGGCE